MNRLLVSDLPHQNRNANAASRRPANQQVDQRHEVRIVLDSRRQRRVSELDWTH